MARRKRMLVVSEKLTRGGLETRLLSQARALAAQGWAVTFATGSAALPPSFHDFAGDALPGLAVGVEATAPQLVAAVDELAAYVRTHHVDVVHGHPWGSFLAAGLVAALTERPLAVTAHGPLSLVTGSPNLERTLYDAVLPAADAVCVVSEELRALLPTALWPRAVVVPNAVDRARFRPGKPKPGGPWLVLSRFEDGKSAGVRDFLRRCPALGITEVHLAGEGAEAASLEPVPGVTVKALGWRDDTAELLHEGYAGVAGMGRVVLEAVAAGLPCVLVGYERALGLVTPERFEAFAFSNFSGRGVAARAPEALAAELAAWSGAQRKELLVRLAAHHDEAALAELTAARLSALAPRPEAFPRLRQVYALLRRVDPALPHAWTADPGLHADLALLDRQPGQPFGPTMLRDARALLEAVLLQTLPPAPTAPPSPSPGEVELQHLRQTVEALRAEVRQLREALAQQPEPSAVERLLQPLRRRP